MLNLSIITVNLNNAAGLRKTLASVVSQDFDSYEYLVIDGGSTDASMEVILAQEQHLAYWVSEPDAGIYAAMNKGIGRARGEYLLFLNSGDSLVAPDVLRRVFQGQTGAEVLSGGCHLSRAEKVLHTLWPPETVSLASFYKSTIPHQSTFIKRRLFETLGYYDESFGIHGDYEFWIRALILGNCTYRAVRVLVTDYNLEGRSAQEAYRVQSEKEMDRIQKRLIPDRVLADYRAREAEREQMEAFYWAQSKPVLHFLISGLFGMAKRMVKLGKMTRKAAFQHV